MAQPHSNAEQLFEISSLGGFATALELSTLPVRSTLATATLDRLLHHATTLNFKGESYRLKEKRRADLLGRAKPSHDSAEAQTDGLGVM